jgi:hypothetical protein
MLVPANVKTLAQRIRTAGEQVPQDGEVALLEWPTTNENHEFRLTFLKHNSDLFKQANGLFIQAQGSDSTVGDGACWLPNGISPEWDY